MAANDFKNDGSLDPERRSGQYGSRQPRNYQPPQYIAPKYEAPDSTVPGAAQNDGLTSKELGNAERGFYNPNDDENNIAEGGNNNGSVDNSEAFKKASDGDKSAAELRNSEGGVSTPSDGNGLYHDEKGTRRSRIKNKLAGGLSNHKLLVAGVGSGGVTVIVIIILLLVMISSLKIPGLAQNITTYNFARLTRQAADAEDRTAEEALAIDTANDATYQELLTENKGIGDSVFTDLSGLKIDSVIDTLGDNNGFKLYYRKTSLFGRGQLYKATIDGTTVDLEQSGGIATFVPLLDQIQTVQHEAAFVNAFQPLLEKALASNNVAEDIRSSMATRMLKEMGISNKGLLLAKFKGDSEDPEAAEEQEVRQKAQSIDENATMPDDANTADIESGDSEVATAEEQALSSNTELAETIAANGVAPNVVKTEQQVAAPSLDTEMLDQVNLLYAAVTPLCIIYDGSVSQSKSTMTNQMTQQVGAFYYTESVADQEKKGTLNTSGQTATELDTATDAANSDYGQIDNTYPYEWASSGSVNTADAVSAEAGAGGGFNYNIFDALTGISPSSDAGKAASAVIGNGCKLLTNTIVATGIGAINILSSILSFGATDEGLEASGQGARVYITAYIRHVFGLREEDQGVKVIGTAFVSRLKKFVFIQGTITAATVGLTEYAHEVVAARSGILNGGTSQGPDLSNEATSGGNIYAGEMERTILFGRPMLLNEVCVSDQEDTNYLTYLNSQKSLYTRYVSPSNADSMLSETAIDVDANLNGSLTDSLMRLGTMFMRPANLFSSLSNMIFGRTFAAQNCANVDFNNINVQFGWSSDEENLINGNNTYKVDSDNQQQLDFSGQEAAIASKYAVCFGYKYNPSGDGTFNPSDPNSDVVLDDAPGEPGYLASLLANADIVRDSDGHVINGPLNTTGNVAQQPYAALCSPGNLTYTNSGYGPDMVFRWRIAMENDIAIAKLKNESEVSED